MLVTSSELYLVFDQFTQKKGQKKKKNYFYCGPLLEVEQVTKPGKSSIVFGQRWCATSVLGSQVFRQALMESCDVQWA